jgi:flagellar basal-body rod protein FlgC
MRALSPSEHSVSMVQVTEIAQDQRPGHMVYSPGHPDANPDGYLEYPNVNIVEEMVNMISASRAYEAGISTVEATQKMGNSALDLGRV